MRLDDIHKRFGSVRALQGSTLSLRPGEVHAVLGENGAGKTTLLRVLAGLSSPDRGELLIAGQPTRFRTSRDAWSAGIGLVHQHFTLVPRFTVLENLALGVRWSARGLGLPLHRVRRQVERLTEATGLRVSLEAPVEALGVGERQRVEILKVLLRETSVLALDEPTAVLTPGEVSSLLTLLRSLAVEGRTVVLVAHKLDEVLSVADHVTVLRAGRTVLEAPRANIDAATLARAMVGEEHAVASRRSVGRPERGSGEGSGSGTPDETVARLDNVTFVGRRGEPALQQVDLEVRKGEIVGIAGVEGNGQRELALVLAGRVAVEGGSVALPPDPGFIPQDRAHGGLVPDFDLAENIALALHRSKHWRRGPLLDWRGLRAMTRDLMSRFCISAPGTWTRARTLSGGNQQRVVVARELEAGRDFLVAENPTRGLDVMATAFVHDELRRLRRGGETGIALLSTDLDEVLTLADRVFVMIRGRLAAVPDAERTRDGVGARMLSATRGELRAADG